MVSSGTQRHVNVSDSPASTGGAARRGSAGGPELRGPRPEPARLPWDAGRAAAATAAASAASAVAASMPMGSSCREMACSPAGWGKGRGGDVVGSRMGWSGWVGGRGKRVLGGGAW